ncbi:MAG: hypothetical protein RL417_1172 [Pseudomonadota bacterium]|jgi:hypothetical protein
MIFQKFGVIVLASLVLGGCNRSDRSNGPEGNLVGAAQEGNTPAPVNFLLAPKISMKSEEDGVPKPVLQIEMTDSSGAKKRLDIADAKEIGSEVQFSISFDPPPAGVGDGKTANAP